MKILNQNTKPVIPPINFGDGAMLFDSSSTESGIGNFNYMNGFNFYPETVTNGKCGEEYKGFCMRNRYCDEWGQCRDKPTTKTQDHKKNATDNMRYRLCNSANDGVCIRYMTKEPDFQNRFSHSFNIHAVKY